MQIDIDAGHAEPALSDGGQSASATAARRCARCCRCCEQKTDRAWREQHREAWSRSGGRRSKTRAMQPANPINPQRVAWELSPRLPDACDHHQRLRLLRQLVRARPEDPARHDGLAVRRPRLDGRRRALRHRRQVRPSRPAGDRAGRRRRHADEQHGRADHRRQILAATGPTRAGSCCVFNNEDLNQVTWEQRVHGRRPEVRRLAAHPQRALSQVRRADRAQGHLRRRPRRRSAPAWDEALAADRPVVLEVKTDPEVPPLPPHITLEAGQGLRRDAAQGRPRARAASSWAPPARCWPRSCPENRTSNAARL